MKIQKTGKLTLSEDLTLESVDTLLEWGRNKDPQKVVQKGVKKLNKVDKATQTKGWVTRLKKEISPEGRQNYIYLATPTGWESKPHLIGDIISMYQENAMDPRIVNAIVVTPDKKYISRRGLEDLWGKGVSYTRENVKLNPGYSIPWNNANNGEDAIASMNAEKDASQPSANAEANNTAALQDTSATEQSTNTAAPAEDTSATEIPTAASQDVSTQSDTQQATNPDVKENAPTDVSIANISDKIMEKFRALDKLTGLQVIDGMGKAITDTSIITKDSAPTYKVIIDNKKFKLTDFLLAAMKQGFLREELARAPLFEALLTEAPNLIFTDNELNNPDSIDFKKIIKDRTDKEEAEKAAEANRIRKAELHNKHANIIDKIEISIGSGEDILETIEMLHNELVPPQGEAETVAGEIVRAMMRLLSRSYNDGDKFYSGYGLETCGGSAEYLYDMDSSFSELLQHIVDEAYRIDSNDDLYDDMLKDLTQLVIEYIMENPEFFEEENTEDSRNYHSRDWDVETEQPRYEFEIMGSADVEQLVEEGIIDAWALNSYVESALEYESWYNNDVEIERPWSHNSTTVTLSNLTKDALEGLSDMFRDDERIDRFWEDLVSEYEDELDSQTSDDNLEEENFDGE